MFKRLREPSTWAGVAAIFQGLKYVLPVHLQPLADGLTVAAGGMAAALREGADHVAG